MNKVGQMKNKHVPPEARTGDLCGNRATHCTDLKTSVGRVTCTCAGLMTLGESGQMKPEQNRLVYSDSVLL